MSFSFSFSHRPLLHKTIENQWFDRSPKETQSSLTALELAEAAYAERLASITMPDKPPVVIGKIPHSRYQERQAQRMQEDHQHQHSSSQPQRANRRPTSSGSSHQHHGRRSASEMSEIESYLLSSDTTQHHDDDNHTSHTDDVSTVFNPNRGGGVDAGAAPSAGSPVHQEAAMFWNRSRRSSAGGDRLY